MRLLAGAVLVLAVAVVVSALLVTRDRPIRVQIDTTTCDNIFGC